jgi:hypothetical protein
MAAPTLRLSVARDARPGVKIAGLNNYISILQTLVFSVVSWQERKFFLTTNLAKSPDRGDRQMIFANLIRIFALRFQTIPFVYCSPWLN